MLQPGVNLTGCQHLAIIHTDFGQQLAQMGEQRLGGLALATKGIFVFIERLLSLGSAQQRVLPLLHLDLELHLGATRGIDAFGDGLLHRHNLFLLRQAVVVNRQPA
ncbi:hypothetical protein D3C76_1282940 [compost metagenome]